jgi:hypothetical protein
LPAWRGGAHRGRVHSLRGSRFFEGIMSAGVCVNGRKAFGPYLNAGPYSWGWRSCLPLCGIMVPSHRFPCLSRAPL